MADLCRDPRCEANHSDQCQYGARSAEDGLPVKKPTTMQAMGIKLKVTTATCTGDDRCDAHTFLQGSIPGSSINRTAISAVYCWGYCAALCQDFVSHLLNDQKHYIEAELFDQFYSALWSCARCKHGKHRTKADGTVENTPPHTRVRGQCKFPQDGGPHVPGAWKKKSEHVPPGGVPDADAPVTGGSSGSTGDPVLPPVPLGSGDGTRMVPSVHSDDDEVPPPPDPGSMARAPHRLTGKQKVSFGPGIGPGKHDVKPAEPPADMALLNRLPSSNRAST